MRDAVYHSLWRRSAGDSTNDGELVELFRGQPQEGLAHAAGSAMDE
jgi:hypothetical protein